MENKTAKTTPTETAIRVIFAIYFLSAYILALTLNGIFQSYNWKVYLAVIGLIFYIVAILALLIMHKHDSREFYEFLIVAAIPFLAYFLLYSNLGIKTKEFWEFIGFFYFAVIAGGFFIGIVFSPIIYIFTKTTPYTKQEAIETVKTGINFVKKLGLIGFGIILLSGTALGVIYVLGKLMIIVEDLEFKKKALLLFFLVIKTFIIAKTTYLHTTFGCRKNT